MSTLNIADKMFEKKRPGVQVEEDGEGAACKGLAGLRGPLWQRMIKKFMWRYYGEMFLKVDDWIDLTTEEIVKLEEECMRELPMRMLEKDKGDVTSWV